MSDNKRYNIIAIYDIYGKPSRCLATTETESGGWCICYSEEQAKKRVEELKAIGMDAWYEEAPYGTQWYDDPSNFRD